MDARGRLSPALAAVAAVGLALVAVACQRGELDRSVQRSTQSTIRVLHPAPGALALPLKDGSVRFAVIGDVGRGDDAQYDIAKQMTAWRAKFAFDFVLMLGDNIYPPHTPDDYRRKFEVPYRPLLDAGVTFHAAIGNHDDDGQLKYAHFNMGGERYYTFKKTEKKLAAIAGAGVRFFALDSRSLDPAQLEWLRRELKASGSSWKIVYMHHPLYTSGRYTSAARGFRSVLESMLVEGDVDVVLSGHEHFYERLVPQRGISYFISGGGGALRKGDIRRPSDIMAAGYDEDCHFVLMELSGDELYFQAISRTGETVDAGVIVKGDGEHSRTALPPGSAALSLGMPAPTPVHSGSPRTRRHSS
jgi:predicted phosphodiesterase